MSADLETRVDQLAEIVANLVNAKGAQNAQSSVGLSDIRQLEDKIDGLKEQIASIGSKASAEAVAHAKRSINSLKADLPSNMASAIEPLVDEVFSLDKKSRQSVEDLSRAVEAKTQHAVSAADQMRSLMVAQTTVAANTIRTFVRDAV
jgi:F0F1-type ATP synthase membrane subunit b/b'